MRDIALEKVLGDLCQGMWFSEENASKHSRMLWEGIFYLFWHADKSVYQRDVSLKIASILGKLGTSGWNAKKKLWFESCLYIFDKHWDKVDNFRIDKFMMLVRNMISESFTIFKESDYQEITWFADFLQKFMKDPLRAQGLLLQLTDVYIPELGKVDNLISLNNLAQLLKPFLYLLASTDSNVVRERVQDNVFNPLIQSNVTPPEDSEDSEPEDITQVDGGKLSKATRREVNKMIN